MTDFLGTLGLLLLAWLALSVVAVLGFHLALAPRRAERKYRRWMR